MTTQPRNDVQNNQRNLPIQQELILALELMQEFESLLEQETQALREADFETAKTLQARKQDLSQRYHERVLKLNKRRDEIAKTDNDLKEKMVNARVHFTEKLTENLTTIESVRKSSQRLIERIVDAAREAVKKDPAFANKGFGKKTPISIAINEEL